jgi:plasmid stability protein
VARPYQFSETNDTEVRDLLRQAAMETNPPSLHEFARRHGLHVDTPRKRFAQEANVLSVAHQKLIERKRQEQYVKALESYTRSAESLRERGMSVHERSLQQDSGLVAFSQNEVRVRALRTVLAQHRHVAARALAA